MKERSWKMVPGRRLAISALGGAPLALTGDPIGYGAALAYDGLLLVAAGLEARALAGASPDIERRTESRLVVGAPNRITVRLRNTSSRVLRLTFRDDLPEGFVAEPSEIDLVLPPWATRDVSYVVVPPQRGLAEFGDLHVRIEGPIGMGAAIVTVAAAESARVYPNVLGPRRYELAARLGELRSHGFRSVRVTGGGGEFEQLREYVAGDALRDLDWKSSAKRQRPITRVLQQERSQLVMLAIDAGRMMAGKLDDEGGRGATKVALTKLDHAINAALLLAYVALKQGDRVGLIVFAEDVRAFVPAGRGSAQYRRLLESLFAVKAELTYVDFARFVEGVRRRMPRRALLVIFSDLLDEAHAMPLAEHAGILRKKHLPVCVTMKDPAAERLASARPATEGDAYVRAAAADLLAERAQVKAHLRSAGVSLVEAPPGELAVATVNRYLELKARNAL